MKGKNPSLIPIAHTARQERLHEPDREILPC